MIGSSNALSDLFVEKKRRSGLHNKAQSFKHMILVKQWLANQDIGALTPVKLRAPRGGANGATPRHPKALKYIKNHTRNTI